jgi:homocysteine S-methyltransferase
VLMEAAIVERLRRSPDIELHPLLVNAPLVYDRAGRAALRSLYQGYIDIAIAAKIPFMMCAPTWRANQARVTEAGTSKTINIDAAEFMHGIRNDEGNREHDIRIGGLIGCKNDCYLPGQALSAGEAESFHGWQIDQLRQGGVDFLIAQTLPSVEEAVGIAHAMAKSGLPYFISFVISRDGRVLDGTPLESAIRRLDAVTGPTPVAYMVNCAYPSFLQAGKQPPSLFNRLTGILANASSLDQAELDGSDELQMESVSAWGDLMLQLNREHGVRILGGCCGTNQEHLQYLVDERR